MVRPADNGVRQRVSLERYSGGAWRPLREVTVRNVRGYFTATAPPGRVRFVWNGVASRSAVNG